MLKEFYFYIGKFICHQLPDRTLIIGASSLPVCSRCTGIYLGIFIALIILFVSKRIAGNKPPKLIVTLVLVVLFLPMIFDGVLSYLHLKETNNLIRLITGSLFAIPLCIFIILAKNFKIDKKNTLPIVKNREVIIIPIVSLILLFVILNSNWFIVSTLIVFSIIITWLSLAFLLIKKLVNKHG